MTDKPLTDVAFSNFDLHPELLAGLERAGFSRCTPIQALTLPVALPGGDVAGQAQTGTGKTLAFLIALMNRLLTRPALADRKPEDPRALILAPTRELAIQIHKDAVKFGSDLGLRFSLIYGGVDYDKQREQLREGTDVIIATPGRLIDYVKQHKVVSLHACEVCVLDEADRMFDLGFIKDIRFLLRRMPVRTERQTLLFSATLSHRVLELAYEHMNEPEKLVVETETITAARVRQRMYLPAMEEKIPLLIGLMSRAPKDARSMVFVNTKVWVERVARSLERAGFRVGVLSGDVPQKKRETLLGRFQKGQLDALVATDVAARGLHIDDVTHVFNYDLPFDAEDYVHRIGRTARLGAEGDAISFACEMYAMSLPDVEAYIDQKIPVEPVTPDLLVAQERETRELAEGEEVESVSKIFREAREEAEASGRGGPRGGSRGGGGGGGRSGGRDGARSGSGPRSGSGDRPRPPRRDASDAAPATDAPADAKPATDASPVTAPSATPQAPSPQGQGSQGPAGDVAADGTAPKRRRRRGGRGRKPADGQSAAPQDNGEAKAADGSPKPPRAPRKPRGEGRGEGRNEGRGEASAREPRAARPSRPERSAPPSAPAQPTSLLGKIKRGLSALIRGGDKRD